MPCRFQWLLQSWVRFSIPHPGLSVRLSPDLFKIQSWNTTIFHVQCYSSHKAKGLCWNKIKEHTVNSYYAEWVAWNSIKQRGDLEKNRMSVIKLTSSLPWKHPSTASCISPRGWAPRAPAFPMLEWWLAWSCLDLMPVTTITVGFYHVQETLFSVFLSNLSLL